MDFHGLNAVSYKVEKYLRKSNQDKWEEQTDHEEIIFGSANH